MLFLWLKVWHIVFVVTWFAGLFYLPRLFVYHAEASNQDQMATFKVMQRKLYYYITCPSGILASLFGLFMMIDNVQAYRHAGWMHLKLVLVLLLWVFHLYCGRIRLLLSQDKAPHSQRFYRLFNEIPSFILIAVIILVVIKPF